MTVQTDALFARTPLAGPMSDPRVTEIYTNHATDTVKRESLQKMPDYLGILPPAVSKEEQELAELRAEVKKMVEQAEKEELNAAKAVFVPTT